MLEYFFDRVIARLRIDGKPLRGVRLTNTAIVSLRRYLSKDPALTHYRLSQRGLPE